MLTGNEILKQVNNGGIVINPFNESNLGPNSYDLTLGPELRVYKNESDLHGRMIPLDVIRDNPTETYEIHELYGFVLCPNVLYLGHTNEVAGSKKFMPYIDGRSSIGRLGIQVHLTAGRGDVGFISQWTLEIVVIRPVRIYRDIRICQIYFDTLEGTIDRLYDGKYVNSVGAVASRAYKDKENERVFMPEHMKAAPGPITFGHVEKYCSVCGDQQYHTPGGWTCQNGHGGAPELDMDNRPLNTKRICACGARFVAASDEDGQCWRCGGTKNFEVIDGTPEGER